MIYIFIAMIFYTIAILFGRGASRHADTNLVAGLTNLISAIIPLAVAVPILSKKAFSNQRLGLVLASLAGVAIAIFAMAIVKSYSINKVGIVAPIVFGGALFLSTIGSYFIYKEKVTLVEFLGLAFLGIGLVIIIYARAATS